MAYIKILAEVTGSVWKVGVQSGMHISEDSSIMIIESMKMEIPIVANVSGCVVEILVKEGDVVEDGQAVAIVET